PAFLHEGPFSSRLEFSDHAYGVGKAEKVDGRVLFEWPSPVRLGPEATRLSGQIFGNEGQMGVASPKRFIWDTSRSINTWHLNPYGRPKLATDIEAQPRKAFKGSVPQKLTDEGELVGSGQLPTVEPQYSRSSLTTFLLIELIQQAFCQVNAAYVRYSRGHRNRPRRLRKIILTVPTAMTLEERLLFHRRAANACKILWPLVGEKRPDVSVTLQEQLNDQWDEAVATQAVFLYGETVGRFKESMDDFFQTSGAIRSLPQKLREDIRDAGHADVVPEEAPCLRLASLDIGGGTTDLIVTSYYLVNKGIYPVQNFREGFNVAGDDILGELVQKVVLPALALSLENEGHPAPLELINDLVGPDREGATIAADSNMRRQFCGHILIPIALRLIDLYENPGAEPNGVSTISIDDLATADDRARSQLDQHARRKDERGGRIFETSLFDLSITASAQSVEDVVSSVMGSVVIDLAEIVYAHSCDFLLLAGRPSRLPALKKILLSHLPIAPHRLIPMHDYRVGPWYPFQRIDNRVHDPKMTVSVGAMICAMSEGVLQNFFLHSNRLHMRSTARHIGPVRNYRIEPSEVYFADVDFDSDDMAGAIIEKEISFTYPTQIGFRQMRHGRWQATPYYDLRYSDETMGEAVRPQAPIRVTLSLKVPSEKDPTALTITSAEDATGRSVKSALSLRLQTLSAAGRKGEQHWLDAGIFDVNQVQEFMAMFRHSSSSKTS
ncbi:MAG: virulence factor SrfB, partial [Pseudomonadota bacterium]